MRAVIQRVTNASVSVDEKVVSEIGKGLMVLVGITEKDTKDDADYIMKKVLTTRFWDHEGKRWNKSVKDMNYEVLLVSQFTLFSVFKGTKLDFHRAMSPDRARVFFDDFVKQVQTGYSEDRVQMGAFGEMMDVKLSNDGPVTIIVDSTQRVF